MTPDRDDTGEDALANIDLHLWRVPPPATVDRSALLVRALSPAARPAKRPRLRWLVAAIVLVNAAIATLVVILLERPAEAPSAVTVQVAGGDVDVQVRDLLQRLDREQHELERRLAEIEELRAVIVELSKKVRQYEQKERRDHPAPKHSDRVDRQPIDPYVPSPPSDSGSCDEVSCVLTNYEGACCAKFRGPPPPSRNPPPERLPDKLDREAIVSGIASVKARVGSCADASPAMGVVKVHVRVEGTGSVASVVVEATPDAALGACVEAAVQRAVFRRTHHGGTFRYPFVF